MVPNEVHMTIKKAMEQNKEFKALYENDEKIKQILDIAMALEGMPRQASTHACGIIIAREPVVNYVPLYARDGVISTQYIMTTLEELGLLKMDFLGLRTLTVIRDAMELIKQNRGVDVEFDKDMADPNVYKLWQDGNTIGIFQFESQGMTNFVKELKPDCLEDIIAGVSLYRPGPMDQIPRYIMNKKDPEHAIYTHPSLKPILKVTYGCMVYQEQVMQIVRDLAGYSLGRADLVRRAMGKKKLDVMAKERENFVHGLIDENGNVVVPGCIRNGIDEVSANKIFDEMAEFAKYAFNKSHAACYAVVAYRTAFLKAYYPAEFMAAMLNSFLGNLDKVPIYINECRKMNIQILKPDINKSFTRFTVEDNQIRFGMGSIKNVGLTAIENIVNERKKNGDYKDFTDFCERIYGEQVNKKCIESLIRAGTFDGLGKTRGTLIASFEQIIDTIASANTKNFTNQITMFDIANTEEDIKKMKYDYIEKPEFSDKEILSMEKEMLGIYISGHPLEKYRELIENKTTLNTMIIEEANEMLESSGECSLKDGKNITIAGVITGIKKKFTKNNKLMVFISLEDLYGPYEVISFENAYMNASQLINEDNIIVVNGRISIRNEQEVTIVANSIKDIESLSQNGGKNVENLPLQINVTDLSEEQKGKLRGAIRILSKQNCNRRLSIKNGETISDCGSIYCDNKIIEEFKKIAGEKNVN